MTAKPTTSSVPDRPGPSPRSLPPSVSAAEAVRRRGVLVLTNSRTRGGLTAVRALGVAGWRVGVASPTGDGLASRSRWCHQRHVVPRPRGDGRDFVAAASEAIRDGGYGLVVGAADDWAMACSTWADDLPARVAHPTVGVASRAVDKLALSALAADHGLAAPRTLGATSSAIDEWRGPAVVKCRTHWAVGSRAQVRIEATLAEGRDAITAAVSRITEAGLEPVLQEVVGGQLIAVIGVVVDGRLRSRVQQRAAGTWPTPLGVSSAATTVPVDDDLVARCESLLTDIGWEGIVELQFLDDGSDHPVLIDLNGRYFGSMSLAVESGADIPDAAALVASGLSPGPLADGRVGVTYVWAAGEIRRAWNERTGGLARDLLTATRRIASADVQSVLSLRDAGPALWLARQRLRVGG